MKNNRMDGSRREKIRRYRLLLPVIVLVMGLSSIGLMLFAEKIGRQKSLNYLYSDIIHEIQVGLSRAHLIIEEHIEGNAGRDVAQGLLDIENASVMLQTLLDGGGTSHGFQVKPVDDEDLRNDLKDLGMLISSFRAIALDGMKARSRGVDLRLNAIYYDFLDRAFRIDAKLQALATSRDTHANRLFAGVIAFWVVILSVAIAGLLFRERQAVTFEKALVNAKNEWEHTFDVIPDMIAVIDKDHRITRVNRTMAEKMGKEPVEILGQKCHEIFHRSAAPVGFCPHEEMMRDGKEHTLELFEKSLNPMGIADLAGNITYVNQAFVSHWGYRKEEIIGKPGYFLGGSHEAVSELLQTVRSTGEWTGQQIAKKKDGSHFPVELSAHLVKDDDGNPLCIMASFTNIAKRKRAEEELQAYQEQLEVLVGRRTAELASAVEELREEVVRHTETTSSLQKSEQKFRELSQEFNILLNAIPDRLVLMSPDLRVLWVNRVALGNLLGDDVDMAGHYCYTLWHGRKTPCNDCPVLKTFTSGDPASSEISTPDGRLWSVRGYPIKDDLGQVKSVMEVSTDITEKVLMQAQRMRANHLASIGELAAGVAHEINNPINGIINYAQILRNRTEEGSRERDVSERIIKEGERVAFIVKSLLSFARERKEEKVPVHVSAILSDALSLTEVHLRKNAIGLTIQMPEELPRVRAHPQQVQQVFLNIINNARYALNEKYPQADPDKVFIIRGEERIADSRRYVCLVFEDHGTGIREDALGKVMIPFFTTKPVNIGTGLGLSISHGIISDHGGTIEIESREGQYTRVSVLIPAYEG